MPKKMTYTAFLMLPVKARNSLVADVLSSKWGYNIDSTPTKRDKAFKKALIAFQKSNNITGNAVVCETTFNLLEITKWCKENNK